MLCVEKNSEDDLGYYVGPDAGRSHKKKKKRGRPAKQHKNGHDKSTTKQEKKKSHTKKQTYFLKQNLEILFLSNLINTISIIMLSYKHFALFQNCSCNKLWNLVNFHDQSKSNVIYHGTQ